MPNTEDSSLKPPVSDPVRECQPDGPECHPLIVKAVTTGTFISLLVMAGLFALFVYHMGLKNMFGTIRARGDEGLLVAKVGDVMAVYA